MKIIEIRVFKYGLLIFLDIHQFLWILVRPPPVTYIAKIIDKYVKEYPYLSLLPLSEILEKALPRNPQEND